MRTKNERKERQGRRGQPPVWSLHFASRISEGKAATKDDEEKQRKDSLVLSASCMCVWSSAKEGAEGQGKRDRRMNLMLHIVYV